MTESTQVQIRRKPPETHLPARIANKSKRVLASVFKDGQPLGLEDKETEKKLLKRHLNIDENATDYGDKRNEFWKNFRLVVPMEGEVLNTSENGDGEPNDTLAYITYLWAKNHPQVADSEDEMKSSYNKDFYIYDPVQQTQKENLKVQGKKQAYIKLAEVSDDKEKLEILGRVLLSVNVENLSKEQLENHLADYIEANPSKFVKMASDPDVEIRAEIDQMVDKGILRKQGNSIIYMDMTIGDSMAEAINFFKNKRNSETIVDLRAKLKDLV